MPVRSLPMTSTVRRAKRKLEDRSASCSSAPGRRADSPRRGAVSKRAAACDAPRPAWSRRRRGRSCRRPSHCRSRRPSPRRSSPPRGRSAKDSRCSASAGKPRSIPAAGRARRAACGVVAVRRNIVGSDSPLPDQPSVGARRGAGGEGVSARYPISSLNKIIRHRSTGVNRPSHRSPRRQHRGGGGPTASAASSRATRQPVGPRHRASLTTAAEQPSRRLFHATPLPTA